MSFSLSWMWGVGFGMLAGLCAFVITFESYRRRRFPARRIWYEAGLSAAVAFGAFFGLALLAGAFLAEIH